MSGEDTGAVRFVVPDSIDDPTRPSGGNIYDQRVREGLLGLGWDVQQLSAQGSWPHPTPDHLARLAARLADSADGALVLVDGLVGSAAAQALVAEAPRLRMVPLVHMPLDTRAERALFESSSAVVTTSAWTRQRVLERCDVPSDLVHVAEPGVDMADPATGTESGTQLLCVAAVTRSKGQDVLLEALARLLDLDWRLTLVGPLDRDPVFVEELRGLVETAGVAGRVRFAGTCSREEVRKAYGEADVLVLASRSETYGMVVTEALAHGLPVMTCAVGGVAEALGRAEDGSTPGVVVPPDDPEALAVAIRRWLADPLRRHRLRRAAGLRRLTLTSWSRTARQVSAVLAGAAR